MNKHILPNVIIILTIILLLSTHVSAALTNLTMLDDNFESDFSLWTDNGITDWTLATDQYVSATHSAYAGSASTNLYSDNLDMSDATMINVTFSYRINAIDANDNINIYYYDGADYDLIDEIGDDAEATWLTFSQVTTDSQYFDNGFHIYFDSSSIDTNENIWIDNVLIIKEHNTNTAPTIDNITTSHSTIKGGNTITFYANTTTHLANDTDTDTLYLYCAEDNAPTAINTNCTGGTLTDSTHPYALTCTFSTASDSTSHTEFCRLYDGTVYSSDVNISYTTDSTPPTTSITNVAGDTTPSYFDTNDDSITEINITGETNMVCRWSSSDVIYSSMSNDCTIDGTTANCQINDISSQGYHTRYISCRDSLENGQSTSQNLDINFYLDYTNPTTSDNGASIIQTPPYTITITETDNIDSDPITKYCTDTTNTCTPSTTIDNGGTITFNSSDRGQNYLRYNSTDDAGNNQAIQSQTVNINQLPTFTSASDNATTIPGGAIVNVSVIASDEDTGQEITIFVCNSTSATFAGCNDEHYCNTTGTANISCTFSAESDSATHTWYAFIYDELDESATTNYSGSYTTDSTSPTLTINNPSNTTYTQTDLTLSITLNETGSWAGYSINGTANISLTNTSLTEWSADIENIPDTTTHNITFYANDSYGNMKDSSTVWFTIDTTSGDTTSPTITIWSPTNNSNHTSSTVLFNITTNENISWAGYSLNSASNISLENLTSSKLWNNTSTVSDGLHNVTFYANDTSTNNNMGSSVLTYFTVDTNPPTYSIFNSTPISANDIVNITCYANWSDNLNLDYGYVEHNETGTATNSSQILLTSANWTNYTIYSGNTTPGLVYCKFYAFDRLGNVNTTQWNFTITDTTAPTIDNLTYIPNTTTLLDPSTTINITANISDNYNFDTAILQYRRTNETIWSNVTMDNTTGSLTGFNVTFTPTNGTWSFRLVANDSTGNSNTTDTTNITVTRDKTWTNSTTIPDTKSITITDTQIFSVGNLTLENTGDYWLNISLTSNNSKITFNGSSETLSFNLSNSSGSETFNVTANTTGYSAGTELPYRITITVNTTNTTSEYAVPSTQTIDKKIRVLNSNGPYLTISIDTYDPEVNINQEDVTLIATINNYGTQDAIGTWLNWTLPSGWSVTQGSLNREIGNLPIGESATNTLKVTIGTTEEDTSITITTNTTQEIGATDSKNVTVGSPAVIVVNTPGPGGSGLVPISTPSITKFGRFDVVRGENTTFQVPIKNTRLNFTLEQLTLEITGFPSQYIVISPKTISKVDLEETEYFYVSVYPPAYMSKKTHLLTFKISGKEVGTYTTSYKNTLYADLTVREVSEKEVVSGLKDAKEILNEFEKFEIPSTRIENLISEIEDAYTNENYELSNQLTERLNYLKETAFTSKDLIETISNNIFNSEASDISVTETKKLLGMAKAAFEREDFETALSRLKEAEIIYTLETRGKINYIKLMVNYWYLTLLGLITSGFLSILGYRKYKLYMLTRSIKNLDSLENKILDLIKESQIKMFIKKKLGPLEYQSIIEDYNKKLSEIQTNRLKLRSRRRKLLKLNRELDELKEEYLRATDLIKSLQESYFNKRTIGPHTYQQRFEQYSTNKIEIEEQIALSEAKLAKNLMFEEMGLGTFNKLKRLFGKKIPKDKEEIPDKKISKYAKKNILKQHEEIKKQITTKQIGIASKQIFKKPKKKKLKLPDFDKQKRKLIASIKFRLKTIHKYNHNRLTKKLPTKGKIKHHLRKLKGKIKNKIIGW
jgi:hypothetical protein